MSTIKRVSIYSHCNELGGKIWNPAIRWTRKYAVFITLEDGDGAIGLGECWCFDSSPDVLLAYLRTEIAPLLVGASLDDMASILASLWRRATLTARHGLLASAISGVDIACLDLRSQRRGVPLHAVLGTRTQQPLPLYASGGLYGSDKSVEDLANELQAWNACGFPIVKMKVGALSVSEDSDRVLAVLEALDDSARLIVDGVYSYSAEQALALYGNLPANRIEAFQSPLPAADVDGMCRLRSGGVPVMGIEAEYRDELIHRLLDTGALAYLQLAPIACGGLSSLTRFQPSLHAAGIKLSLEVSSTAVALLAACHYAAANDCVAHVEYHTLHQVFFDLLPWQPEALPAHAWQLPDLPGLGITLPLDRVDEACVVCV